jgi:predicted secreted Zn-dependent protease
MLGRMPFRPSLAVIALLLPAVAQAQSTPDPLPPAFAALPGITIQYYDVRGTTQAELAVALRVAALTAPGLAEPGKPSAAARTIWKAGFAWDKQTNMGLCRTRSPRTNMQVTVILPRLVNPDRVDPAGQAAWRDYIAGVERHEAGHARIAFAHAHDFESDGYGASCADIQTIGQKVVDRITALQIDYDRRTQDGRAQGDITE